MDRLVQFAQQRRIIMVLSVIVSKMFTLSLFVLTIGDCPINDCLNNVYPINDCLNNICPVTTSFPLTPTFITLVLLKLAPNDTCPAY